MQPAPRYPVRWTDPFRARHRTAAQIRAEGAIGSLNDGVEIEIHGVRTRLIAWPGTGFQTEAVHVLTLTPGQQTAMHSYGLAEEAVLALQGEGEAYVRGEWVGFGPGDMAFSPPPVEHAIRATPGGPGLIAVAAISPPEFELYEAAGLYNRQYGVINSEAAWFARSNADPGTLVGPSELAFHDADSQVRAENLSVNEIRSGGALFNVFSGAKIDVIDAPMVFVLWPGYGPRSTGFHFANGEEGLTSAVHTHPASDECVVLWDGTAKAWAQVLGTTWSSSTWYSRRAASNMASAWFSVRRCGVGLPLLRSSTSMLAHRITRALGPLTTCRSGGWTADAVWTEVEYDQTDEASGAGRTDNRWIAWT
jgi:quercetin dioxygenase-like cupin family protein